MTQTSCINHPARSRFIKIHDWQLVLCDGNVVAAALLSFFEYWHNIKLEIQSKNVRSNDIAEVHGDERSQDETTLHFHSEEELINGIQQIGKRDSIRKAINWLEDKGFISIHKNPNKRYAFDKTRYFQFHPKLINEWLSGSSNNLPSMSKNQQRSSINQLPQSKNQLPQSENTLAITEITSNKATEITSNTLPPTPQGERESKKTFGFEIPEETNPDTQALVISQAGTLRQEVSTLTTVSVPPLAKTDKFFTGKTQKQEKYERWERTAHPALVYDGENTPWLEPPAGTEFVRFNQNFVDWHTTRDMQKFHKQDRFQAEGDFKGALRNDPERCASRWAEYHKHMVTHAATAAARVNNGMEITEAEKQKFAKHQRAFIGTNPDSVSGVDQKVLDAGLPVQPIPQLESVATVEDSVWDSVAADMDNLESRELNVPEGAESVQAYQEVVKAENRDYWAKFHASKQELPQTTIPVDSAADIKKQIEHLRLKKSMPNCNPSQRKKQTKLEHWNNLMQTGIASVIADVTNQAIAQGYLVVNGQVVEPEF